MHFTRDNIPVDVRSKMALYRKKALTPAAKVDGPFGVETTEGPLNCPDGYLALDAKGNPYPIDREVFEETYELAEGETT